MSNNIPDDALEAAAEAHVPDATMTERVTPEELRDGANTEWYMLRTNPVEVVRFIDSLLLRAADTIEELTAGRALLREAVENEGPVPAHHRRVMARHRNEWPTLWDAIDRLIR